MVDDGDGEWSWLGPGGKGVVARVPGPSEAQSHGMDGTRSARTGLG